MTEYCKGCGIKLPKTTGALGQIGGFLLGGGNKSHEFDDGNYCEKCAKIRVDKKRREI